MPLSLSPDSRSALAEQVTQNGRFIHGLCSPTGLIVAKAFLSIEQCDAAIAVRIDLGYTVNSLTLRRGPDASERVARFLEELASGVSPSSVPEVDEYLLIDDIERMLREAISLGRGTYQIASDELDLCVLLWPADGRTAFRFELNGLNATLPLYLPGDRQMAYELLRACTQELVANYRSGAAA